LHAYAGKRAKPFASLPKPSVQLIIYLYYYNYLTMKNSLFLFLLICGSSIFAQTFNSPESVDYDEVRHRWIVGQNGSGEIHVLNPSTMTLTTLATGIPSGPHGIECVGDTVFVCDGGRVRGYNLLTGAQVFNVNLSATFLNGITWDGGDFLFATDFTAKKIYRIRISTGGFNSMVTTTYTPNGIYYDGSNNRCVFVNWGGTARVQALSLVDSSVTTLYTTAVSNIDGITRDNQCNWYISTWGGNALRKFNPTFSAAPISVMTGLSSPADIDINVAGDSIGIPNSGAGNNVVFYVVPSTPAVVASFISSDTAICEGDIVAFTDQSTGSPAVWSWTFTGGAPSTSSSQNPSITYANAGSYNVQLIAGNPACGADTVLVNNHITVSPLPTASIITLLNPSTLQSSQASGIQWNDIGGPIAGATSQNYSPLASGDYTVTYTDVNGCSATSAAFTFTLNVSVEEENVTANSIYPNPSSGIVTIRLNEAVLNGTISLLDINGKVLVQQRMNGIMMQFDPENLAAGIYYIQVVNAEQEIVLNEKLVFNN
jgi:PKD repeat protein